MLPAAGRCCRLAGVELAQRRHTLLALWLTHRPADARRCAPPPRPRRQPQRPQRPCVHRSRTACCPPMLALASMRSLITAAGTHLRLAGYAVQLRKLSLGRRWLLSIVVLVACILTLVASTALLNSPSSLSTAPQSASSTSTSKSTSSSQTSSSFSRLMGGMRPAAVDSTAAMGKSIMATEFPASIDTKVQAALWAHHANPAQSACPTHKRVIIAIQSTAMQSSFARRQVIRNHYRFSRPVSTVDVVFIIGRPRFMPWAQDLFASQMTNIRLEQAQYGDIIMLDMEENMNDGKTYMLFKTIYQRAMGGRGRTYDYVFKSDDDTFVHYANMVPFLDGLTANATVRGKNAYIGHLLPKENRFPLHAFSGMIYGLSWDLVEWLSTAPVPKSDIIGHEDRMTGIWLVASQRPINYINNQVDFVLYPHWRWHTRMYRNNSIALHECKDIERHVDAANYYYGKWLLGNGSASGGAPAPVRSLDNTPDCQVGMDTTLS
ncbi:hypothetical protein BC831DRAFT_90481 [Entophlyctis helioformis]|nr:hypothetical protein BC831DRAFT_90481 [Entophlyctis helioformis]